MIEAAKMNKDLTKRRWYARRILQNEATLEAIEAVHSEVAKETSLTTLSFMAHEVIEISDDSRRNDVNIDVILIKE